MNIEGLMLKREEIPIFYYPKEGNLDSRIKIITPIPSIIIGNQWSEKKLYALAKEAVNYSFDSGIEKAIIYECDKRQKIDDVLRMQLSKHSLVNDAKSEALKYMGFDENNDKEIFDKWADESYLCIRIYGLILEETNFNYFKDVKSSFLSLMKRRGSEFLEYVVLRLQTCGNSLFCFSLPGNGVGDYIDNGFFTHGEFNMTEKKFDKICAKKKFAYFSHNVDDFYQAIIFREIEINYINNLLNNL